MHELKYQRNKYECTAAA